MACGNLVCAQGIGNTGTSSVNGVAAPRIVQRPVPGYIYTPYVKLSFSDGQYITVGNKSQPAGSIQAINSYRQSQGLTALRSAFNSAVISNFEYGFEANNSGFNCSIEILDAGGASYLQILKYVNKTYTQGKDDTKKIWFDFGWIIQKESGDAELRSCYTLFRKVLHGLPQKVDLNFEGGNVKIKLDIKAPFAVNAVQDKIWGSADNKINLKDALTKLFKEVPVEVDQVEFQGADGGEWNFPASQGGDFGPAGIWRMNQQDKLNTARSWLSSYYSQAKKSFTFIYDGFSGVDNPILKLIIKEDPTDNNKGNDCCGQSIATFIVNGGNDSPVISFTPQINWIFGDKATGAATGGASSGQGAEPIKGEKKEQHAGSMTAVSVQENLWDHAPPDLHIQQVEQGNKKTDKIARSLGIGRASPFEAELKIFGDPQWCSPVGPDGLNLIGKSFSILFINPFTPKVYGNKSSLDWLADPTCNSILSNKNYMILKVNHQISGGMFVTSFKLKCILPNADTTFNQDMGGNNCGAEIQQFIQNNKQSEPTDGSTVPPK